MNIVKLVEEQHLRTGKSRANIRKEIGELFYPNLDKSSKKVMVSDFVQGKRQSIKFKYISGLCEILGVTANELFAE